MNPTKQIDQGNKPKVSLRWKTFWHKLTHWEYWPFNVLYAPLVPYWAWLSLRTKSFFYFTATNPGIEFGGMLGESKGEILKRIDPRYLPLTICLDANPSASEIEDLMSQNSQWVSLCQNVFHRRETLGLFP